MPATFIRSGKPNRAKMKRLLVTATLAWFGFMLIAVASGALREALLTPRLDEHTAHQVGTLLVFLLIAAAIVPTIRRLRPTPRQALAIGAGWVAMTVAFEIGVFHFIVGHPMKVLLADYNLAEGRLWPLVLLTEFVMPWVVAGRVPLRAK
jgi:hypothetical protein